LSRASTLNTTWTAATVGRTVAPVREQVTALLRQAITEFELEPGQRLIERELTERLGVSRATVREALRELTAEGLVTAVPKKGAVVAVPDAADAADLYAVRGALESLIVHRFTQRADDQAVERLQYTVEVFRRAITSGASIREILLAKDRFYAVLIAGAESPVLEQMVESIHARVQVLRATSLSDEKRSAVTIVEIEAIVEAIAARDADRAAALSAEHVRVASRVALDHLEGGSTTWS
jgi:DNA-binding GntR family transcriptional regulator